MKAYGLGILFVGLILAFALGSARAEGVSAGKPATAVDTSAAPSSVTAAPEALTTAAGTNEAVVGLLYAAFNQHSLGGLDQVVSDDFVSDTAYPGSKPGRAGLKTFLWKLESAFPDARIQVLKFVSQGDTTVASYRFSGTQKHAFLGIQATRKHVSVTGVDLWTLEDGKIVHGAGCFDTLGMLVQLGVVPTLK